MTIIVIATNGSDKYYNCAEGTTCSLDALGKRIFIHNGETSLVQNMTSITREEALAIEPNENRWVPYSDTTGGNVLSNFNF